MAYPGGTVVGLHIHYSEGKPEMSRVYWHTRDHGEAEVYGSERAYASGVSLDIAMGIIWPGFRAKETMTPFLADPASYLAATREGDWRWEESAKTWLRVDGALLVDGEKMPFMDLACNTLIALNRPLRLLGWMHGLSESHGYFEPEAHPALAETIIEGRENNVLREGMGWGDVLDLIERVDGTGPIVWSYSVCNSFPDRWELRPPRHPDESDNDYEQRAERFIYDELSAEDAWDRGIELLREKDWPVALHPDIEQGFLNGKTAFDFVASRDREFVQT